MFKITGYTKAGSEIEQIFITFEEAKQMAIKWDRELDAVVTIEYTKEKNFEEYSESMLQKLKDSFELDASHYDTKYGRNH